MVDIALATTVLTIVLGGIALVVLAAIGYATNEAVQNRLDDRAGVPRPGTPAAAPSTALGRARWAEPAQEAPQAQQAERPQEAMAGPTA